ncbi:hypothetical protein FA95DRAFT_1565181, partial [Auriscalpium vulgare]
MHAHRRPLPPQGKAHPQHSVPNFTPSFSAIHVDALLVVSALAATLGHQWAPGPGTNPCRSLSTALHRRARIHAPHLFCLDRIHLFVRKYED